MIDDAILALEQQVEKATSPAEKRQAMKSLESLRKFENANGSDSRVACGSDTDHIGP
jgi:hypothetical protein